MDSFSELLPFLIGAVYLLVKFRRRTPREAAPARPVARPPARSTAGPTPFEQLLARLEQEAGASPTTSAPSPTVVPEPRREFVRPAAPPAPPAPTSRPESPMFAENRTAYERDRARAAEATAFRSLETTRPETSGGFFEARGFDAEARGFEHDRHGFGRDNPTSEEVFSRARDADRRPAPEGRMAYDPHGLTPAAAPRPTGHFGSAAAIREAFVLSTILGRRPPLRRPDRPGGPPPSTPAAGGTP